MHIYIHRDGKQYGPFPITRVPGFIASGDLLPGDLAWHEGAPNWMPLAHIVQKTEYACVPPRRDGGPAAIVVPNEQKAHNLPAPEFLPEAYKPGPPSAPAHLLPVTRKPKSGINKLKKMQRSVAMRNMAIGMFIGMGGGLVAYFSYDSLDSPAGIAIYLLACCVILAGTIGFIASLIQLWKV